MSEFDDIVPTISRNSAQSAQSRTVSERRSTLYMIPKEEQQLMHLFSQSSDLIPQMGEICSQQRLLMKFWRQPEQQQKQQLKKLPTRTTNSGLVQCMAAAPTRFRTSSYLLQSLRTTPTTSLSLMTRTFSLPFTTMPLLSSSMRPTRTS